MAFRARLIDEQQERIAKSLTLSCIAAVPVVLLIVRLFQIQILDAEQNITLSKENRMQLKILNAPRGQIFDCRGAALVRNRPSYSISVFPYKIRNRDSLTANLLRIRDHQDSVVFERKELEKNLDEAARRRFDATRLKEDVSIDVVSVIEEHAMDFPGIVVETESRREYPLGKAAFHVLGYMGEIPGDTFDILKQQGYHYGDVIGKAGIEREYESILRGKDGREYIEVNAYGKSLGPIANMPRTDPVPGKDLYLTIDIDLQRTAYNAFPDTLKGAVVVLNPQNGNVLAMVSKPAVNPNIFSMSTHLRSKNWESIARDPALPLNNRATTGTYTPGSTFKLVSALAGLSSNTISQKTLMPRACTGVYYFGRLPKRCWYAKGHGRLSVTRAVQKSCNIFFYQLGLMLGDSLINHYARLMGLGEPTGIDLPHERAGYLSGEAAHNRRFGRRIKQNPAWSWTRGLLLDLAIGQAQIVTPLQLAVMVGGLGNQKIIYIPHLLDEKRNHEGLVEQKIEPQIKNRLNEVPDFVWESITEALTLVMQPGGTGGRAALRDIQVGGKTGSAENPHGEKTHALFVACAPVDDPVIAISVVVENAGHGGSVAAPVAGAVLRYYFEQSEEGKKIVQERMEKENKRHS